MPRHRGLGKECTTSVRFFGRAQDRISLPTRKYIIFERIGNETPKEGTPENDHYANSLTNMDVAPQILLETSQYPIFDLEFDPK